MAERRALSIHPLRRTAAQVAELRALCDEWGPPAFGNERFWSFDDVLQAVTRPGSLALFAAERDDGPWGGVALVDVGPDAADLLYIYVKRAFRQHGIARALIDGIVRALAPLSGVEALFLEVRIGNTGARKLYESIGMEKIGARRRYYADGEDALVYRLEIAK